MTRSSRGGSVATTAADDGRGHETNAGRANLVYDGSCAFCRRWLERVRRWDRRGRLDLVPYQTPDLEARFPQLSRDDCRQRIHLVDEGGGVFAGAAAGREVLRRLPGGWLWALPLRIPGALLVAEPIYAWITRRWGPLPRRGRARAPAISGSASARAARATALTSALSARYLWAKLRGLGGRRERRAAIMDAYHLRSAQQVVEFMGNMKGLFMKLGQIVSFVNDDVPEQYREVLRQLQTTSPPMCFDLARQVIESELRAPLRDVFRDIDEEPIAAASIGQVHRARLRSGDEVAVKVQYPGVDDAIRADLSGMTVVNGFLGMMSPGLDAAGVAAELRARLGEELDYRREASNQQTFAEIYGGHPFIRIPAVFAEYSTARVLTQRFADGHDFTWLLAQPAALQQRVAEILFRFVFGSIFRFHIFNADPHPGNYRFHEDGTVTFLDFGCVKHFRPEMVADWMEIIRAHLRGDQLGFRRQAMRLGFLRPDSDLSLDAYYECVGYFYAPFAHDRDFTFTSEYNAQSFRVMFDRSHPVYGEVQRKLNLPPDFVLVNRLQWGLNSILTQLRATANWHRILREYLYGEPPSTELGRQSASFRAAWRAERADPGRTAPDQDGVARPRQPWPSLRTPR
jgi:predicted unusual protein kinase regulating ubiquinone biosynthesis (AarF/ABC1/UbiB family)/predicted DCC family thiol-disulfide oxidoreductase YuxK